MDCYFVALRAVGWRNRLDSWGSNKFYPESMEQEWSKIAPPLSCAQVIHLWDEFILFGREFRAYFSLPFFVRRVDIHHMGNVTQCSFAIWSRMTFTFLWDWIAFPLIVCVVLICLGSAWGDDVPLYSLPVYWTFILLPLHFIRSLLRGWKWRMLPHCVMIY